jgi:hypothetical protein
MQSFAYGHHDRCLAAYIGSLCEQPRADWPHVSITHLSEPGSYGLSTERWRYIHYDNGDEELYDCQSAPCEWTNLAESPDHTEKLKELRSLGPKTFAPRVPPKDESLPRLKWHAAGRSSIPASQPDGSTFDIVLLNQHKDQVKLYILDPEGKKSRGSIPTGWRVRRSTQPGSIWLVIYI